MSAYEDFHPFTKQASIRASLGGWVNSIGSTARSAAKSPTTGPVWRNTFKKYKPEIAGGLAGIGGGAYLGNLAYEATIPEVNTLPHYAPPAPLDVVKNNVYTNAE